MKIKLHNKLIIKTKEKKIEFYNELLPSILDCLSNLKTYNNCISIGDGQRNNNVQEDYQLSNHLSTMNVTSQTYQSDISKGQLFVKLEVLIDSSQINSDYITEIGLSNNNIIKPILYNYFYLVNDEFPNGIDISQENELAFEIYVYLYISEEQSNILSLGKNPFIEYLLGGGLEDVFVCRGSNYYPNVRLYREKPENSALYKCTIDANVENNDLILNLTSDIETGETNEILFISDGMVFARLNTKEYRQTITETISCNPKINYVIDLKSDIKTIINITNQSAGQRETNYIVSQYANSLGDKTTLPFNNLFNSTTQRYVSKDGNRIFFILDDKVYGYINEDFSIKTLDSFLVKNQNIKSITSFENYVFIVSYTKPYISTYVIEDYKIKEISNNFKSLTFYDSLAKIRAIDFTLTKNNDFIFGFIDESGTAYTTYFSLTNEQFIFNNSFSKEANFSYLLAMYKNNFCDASIIYLQGGETSTDCKIVVYDNKKTETDVYSSLAYLFTHNTKEINTKSRAIIVEKNETPSVLVYYYPQIYKYELPLLANEIDDYFSTNVNYLIQKINSSEYHIYNLIGYDEPEEFINGFPPEINQNKILDFEFLNDTLLIFLDDESNPIVAYNLNLNKTQIENVSSQTDLYEIEMEKYNKLGLNNEGVVAQITTKISL